MIHPLNNRGFTLIELMLAMGLFSVILVISTAGFIGINRTYTRSAIKKQLSESSQMLSNSISTTIRTPQGSIVECSLTDTLGCPAPVNTWNAVCLNGTRYLWPDFILNKTGVFVDHKKCDEAVDTAKQQIVDSRFILEKLSITALDNQLYRVKGLLHTTDLNGLTVTDNTGVYSDQRAVPDFDAYKTKCKGTSAGSFVQTCAVESFDFIINSRGSTL